MLYRKGVNFWSRTCILLSREPISSSISPKVVIQYKMWPLQLNVKMIAVLLTWNADNAKMLFEAGRRRLLAASRECVGESAEVRGGMI